MKSPEIHQDIGYIYNPPKESVLPYGAELWDASYVNIPTDQVVTYEIGSRVNNSLEHAYIAGKNSFFRLVPAKEEPRYIQLHGIARSEDGMLTLGTFFDRQTNRSVIGINMTLDYIQKTAGIEHPYIMTTHNVALMKVPEEYQTEYYLPAIITYGIVEKVQKVSFDEFFVNGVLPIELLGTEIAQLSEALDYLHTKKKLLHGDVWAGNIMFNGVCVKLTDIGESRKMKKGKVKGSVIGTPDGPPEQEDKDEITVQSDIYSLARYIGNQFIKSVIWQGEDAPFNFSLSESYYASEFSDYPEAWKKVQELFTESCDMNPLIRPKNVMEFNTRLQNILISINHRAFPFFQKI